MHAGRARVNDTLRNPLVIEMGNLLAKDEIFQQRRTARIGLERVLIVGKREALVRGQGRMLSTGDLVQLAPAAGAASPIGAKFCSCLRLREWLVVLALLMIDFLQEYRRWAGPSD